MIWNFGAGWGKYPERHACGFLTELEDWSETVASVLAAQEGITELLKTSLIF
jgi:sulfur relay (sulfurtransferase) DsrC/TusE family protein